MGSGQIVKINTSYYPFLKNISGLTSDGGKKCFRTQEKTSTLTLSCDVGLKLQMFNKSSPETAADASSDGI